MDHRVGMEGPAAAAANKFRARNLRLRNAQPEHRGREMFRRVDRPVHSKDLLGRGDLRGVNKAIAMMREARAQLRPRGQRQQHAARTAVEVQRQIRARRAGGQPGNVRIILEHGCEARLDDDGDVQVRPVGS